MVDLLSIEGALIVGGAVCAVELLVNKTAYNATESYLERENPPIDETYEVYRNRKQMRNEHPFIYYLGGMASSTIALKKYLKKSGKGLPL